jgi:hypothetical protein
MACAFTRQAIAKAQVAVITRAMALRNVDGTARNEYLLDINLTLSLVLTRYPLTSQTL